MSLTTQDIATVLQEVAPVLTGGWIQKIHQPGPLAIVLEIRTPGRTHRLLISCFPETTRLHLTTAAIQNPPSPPPFCQFLRAHLQGAHIDGITQIQEDRIVRIDLTTRAGPRALVAELTGKTANLLVLDDADRLVRELKGSKDRRGQAYRPPPPAQRPLRVGFSTPVAHSVSEGLFPLSAAIEAQYQDRDAASSLETVRTAKIGALKKSIKKLQRRIDAWQDDLTKATKYRDYARYGELLKANLGLIKKGQREVTVVDYFEGTLPTLSIPLDATKTPQGNMDDYFRKHRKYLAAERELRPRIETGQVELAAMRRELDTIKLGTWQPPEPQSAQTPPGVRSLSTSRQRLSAISHQPPARTGPFRRFTSTDGLPIFVGRNARENEDLTFRLAKSEDLWLHARGTPGSHVVVRLAKGQDVPPETLRDAATLALLYSDLKKSGKGDVIYTKRKWVKKAKRQAAGAVTVTQEKSLFVVLDRARLEALKARSG
jgi:predicted ribosome quality control (RQC) complex YloA/Tae2 family protein